MATLQGSWSISGTTATYSIAGSVAVKITGLPSGSSVDSTYGTIDGINIAINEDKTGSIKFNYAAVKGSNKISITTSNGYSCVAELNQDVPSVSLTDVTQEIVNGKLTIKGNSTAGYSLSSDGKTITYSTAKSNQTLASVTNLGTGATLGEAESEGVEAVEANIAINGKVITILNDEALPGSKSKVTTLTSNYGYTLALNEKEGGVTISEITNPTPSVSSGKLTITGTKTEGYTLDGNKITYLDENASGQTLATVTGLSADASSNVDFDDAEGTITLSKAALKNANVKLTLSNGANYVLAFAEDEEDEDTRITPKTLPEEFTYNKGTVVYQQRTTAGHTLAGDKMSATYSAASTATYATIKGLVKDLVDNEETDEVNEIQAALEAGIKVDDATNKITINDVSLLTNSNVTVTQGKGKNYTLVIGTNTDATKQIPTATTSGAKVWSVSGTTATYKSVNTPYYSYDSAKNTIKYNKEANAVTLATVKNLKSGIKADEVLSVSGNVITLKAGAIDITKKKDITLGNRDDYTLKLYYDENDEDDNNVATPELAGDSWSYETNAKTGVTTATFSGGISEGYRISADGKTATYIPAAESNAIVVTGLAKNAANAYENEDGITVNDETGVITIKKDMLGTSSVSVKQKGYRFEFASGDDAPITDVSDSIEVWRVSGTTATYKKVIPAYYTIDSKGAIVYHKETDVKNGTLATVKGLVKGLTIGKFDGEEVVGIEDESGNFTQVLDLEESTGKITLQKDALTTTTVTLTPAKDTNYHLVLGEGIDPPAATGEGTWSVSNGTTAIYKGSTTEGWTQTSDTQITYSKASSNATIATIKGLDKLKLAEVYDKKEGTISEGISIDDKVMTLSSAVLGTTDVTIDGIGGYTLALEEDDTSVKPTTGELGWEVEGTFATLHELTTAGFTASSDNKTLKYSDKNFGKEIVAISGIKDGLTDEDLDYEPVTDDNGDPVTDDEGNTVYKGISAYELDENGEIVYDENDKPKRSTTLTLTGSVLGSSTVEIPSGNNSSYKLALADASLLPVANSPNLVFEESTGKVYVRTCTTAGYTPDGNARKLIYSSQSDITPVATIKGLNAKELKKAFDKTAATIDGLEVDEENGIVAAVKDKNGKITTNGSGTLVVSSNLLNKDDVVITSEDGQNYTLKLNANEIITESDDLTDPDVKKQKTIVMATETPNWVLKSGKATYTVKTTAGYDYKEGYAEDSSTEAILYKKAGTATTTISGLLKTAEGTGETVGGITFGEDEDGNLNGTIELSSDVLPTTTGTVTIADKSGNDYKLALADESNPGSPKWVKAKNATKATYQWDIDEGEGAAYVVNSDGTSINSYAEGSSVVLATLSGLNKDATADDLNGIKSGAKDEAGNLLTPVDKKVEVTEGTSSKEGTITILSRNILGTTNVTLGSKDNYNLALSEDADFSVSDTAAQWNYDAKKGSATIVQGKTAGWALKVNKDGSPEYKTMVYTKPAFTTLATVSGLSTELTYNADAGTITTVDADEETVSLTFDPSTKVITVPTEALNGKNITLGKNDSYTLQLADADGVAVKDTTPYFKWTNGKLEVIGGKDAGYTLKDGKTISYIKAAPKALATITGLSTDKDLKELGTIVVSTDGKSIGFADEDGNFDETNVLATFSDSGVITILNGNILAKKKVTLKSDSYTLALDDTVEKAGESDPEWVKDETKTFATYQKSLTPGYTLSSDLKTITYSEKEENVTVLATLSGLKKGEGYDADGLGLNTQLGEEGAVLSVKEGKNGAAGTITILTNALTYLSDNEGDTDIFSGNISIANKDNYTLVLENDKAFAPTNQAAQWDVSKRGTANYSVVTTEGWVSKKDKNNIADGKNFVYSKQKSTNLASVTGLNSKYLYQVKDSDASTIQVSSDTVPNKYTDEDLADITYSDLFSINDKVITFGSTKSLTNKSKVTVKTLIKSETTPYTIAVADSLKPTDLENPAASVKGTTITLKKAQTAGWVVDEKTSATLSYKDVTGSDTVAIIDGVAKGLKADVLSRIAYRGTNNTKISLPKEALGTTDVTLTDISNTGYTFIDKEEAAGEGIVEPIYGQALWTCKSGTATLTQPVTGGYEISDDGKKISYVATKSDKNATVVTVSGLNKELTAVPFLNGSDKPISVDTTTRIITVNAAALGTSKVTSKSADKNKTYTFAFGDDVVKDTDKDKWQGQTEWATSKGTATYKTYDKGYYTIDTKGAIVYNKESKGTTYLTLTGLNTASSIQSGTGYVVNDTAKTITINENALTNKSITLKANDSTKNDYKLVLGLAEDHDSLTSYESEGWTTSGATATLKGKITAGYALTNDKTITYLKTPKTGQKFATVSGLKSGTTISDSNGEISLSESDLNGKDVTLSVAVDESIVDGGKNFKLGYSGAAPEVSIEDSLAAAWTTNKTKAVLKGAVSAGYILSASGKSITATKATTANKTQDLVTINGLNTGKLITGTLTEDETDARKITVNGDNLSNKVTVTGGVFEVSITSGFSNSSLIGSASADSLSLGGSSITVNSGKGDDYVKFASGNTNNVFMYASGDGNDVIADFTAKSDKIKVTKGTVSVKTATDGTNDVIVSIDGTKGSIRLKNVGGSTINIVDAKDTQTSYATTKGTTSSGAEAEVLMSSSNFLTSSAQLSSIVDGGSDYTVGSLNTTQNATDLTKQSDVVAYSGDK